MSRRAFPQVKIMATNVVQFVIAGIVGMGDEWCHEPSTVVELLPDDSESATFGVARVVDRRPADSMSLCRLLARNVVAMCADSMSLTLCRRVVGAPLVMVPPCGRPTN